VEFSLGSSTTVAASNRFIGLYMRAASGACRHFSDETLRPRLARSDADSKQPE